MIGQGIRRLSDRFTPFLRSLADLAVGTDGQVLTLDGGKPAWGSVVSSYESSQQTITSGGALTLAHGLSSTPKIISAHLVCQTANAGYSAGDMLFLEGFYNTGSTATTVGYTAVPDATNLSIRFGSSSSAFVAPNKSTGTLTALTNTSWKFVIVAVALP